MANIFGSPYAKQQELLRELGYAAPEPRVSQNIAPHGGLWSVPQPFTFAGLVNMATRTFKSQFDEALRESPHNARIMRRDPVCMMALRQRQIPVCQLSHHLEPMDETDPVQMYAAANVTGIIKQIPKFHWMKLQLSEATWYGRYGTQTIYRPDFSMKYKRWVIRDHRPMNGDKMVFKWSGDAGVLVHPLFEGTTEISDRGLAHFFTPEERQTVIIHHFEPEDSDYYDFDLAGAVEGVGVRSRLYFFWYIKQQILKYLLDFMQRVGLGIDVFYFEAGNPASHAEMRMAAQNQQGSLRLLLPRFKDGTGPSYEHIQPNLSGAQMFIQLLTGYFDNIIKQYILGQSLTSETGATGMGSGVAEAHQSTQEMLIEYDATALQETLSDELVKTLYRLNHPGVPPARFVFDVEKPNVSEYLEACQALYEMGVAIDADDLRSVAGLPKPEPGHEIASSLQQSQASTVGVPQGTPVQSAAGQQQQQPPQQQQYARSSQEYRRAYQRQNNRDWAGYQQVVDIDGNVINAFGPDNGDGVIQQPVTPFTRPRMVHKAADHLASLQRNRNGRRSWAVVGQSTS